MLHRGKAHTYGLGGPFGIAYGASVVWFAGSVIVGLLAVTIPSYSYWLVALVVIGISWCLGLIAIVHRRSAWRLLAWETAALLALVASWWRVAGSP